MQATHRVPIGPTKDSKVKDSDYSHHIYPTIEVSLVKKAKSTRVWVLSLVYGGATG